MNTKFTYGDRSVDEKKFINADTDFQRIENFT